MKIIKTISNKYYNKKMEVYKGVIFKSLAGDVFPGKMTGAQDQKVDGYLVRVNTTGNGNRICGACTDFELACDMLLSELNILKVEIND